MLTQLPYLELVAGTATEGEDSTNCAELELWEANSRLSFDEVSGLASPCFPLIST